jgi:mevalonate kinase
VLEVHRALESDAAYDNVPPEHANAWLGKQVLRILEERLGYALPVKHGIVQDIPAGAGLGSSASFAVAFAGGINAIWQLDMTRAQLAELAFVVDETLNLPCGRMDHYSAAFGGTNSYVFCGPAEVQVWKMHLPDGMRIVVADSGDRRRSGDVIRGLQKRASEGDRKIEAFVTQGLAILEEMESRLSLPGCQIQDLGALVNRAHANLKDNLGISTSQLDELVHWACRAGALGAKLTGAGGGGCIFALCELGSEEKVAGALASMGATTYISAPSLEGLECASIQNGR